MSSEQNNRDNVFSVDDFGRLVITDEIFLQEISGGKEGSLVYKGTKREGSEKFNAVCGNARCSGGNSGCGGGDNAGCGNALC